MSTYSYIDGEVKENPTMEKPKRLNYSLQSKYNAAIEDYHNHIASLKTYIVVNFPSSYVGRKDLVEGKNFRLQYQWFVKIHPDLGSWNNCSEDDYNYTHPQVKRIIAIPIKWNEAVSTPIEEKADHVPDVTKMVDKPDCSQHPRDLFGHTDMKEVAEAIGDLHYETLTEFLFQLSNKFRVDAEKDNNAGRNKLAQSLHKAKAFIANACYEIITAANISKPFMDNKTEKK